MPLVKENDLEAAHQRIPLVNYGQDPMIARTGLSQRSSDSDQTDDADEDETYYDHNKNYYNDKDKSLHIPIQPPDYLPKFPKEKQKTFVALGLMTASFLINSVSIALTHDRVPDRDKVPPLPDFVLDNLIEIPQLMRLPDVLVMITIVVCAFTIIFHKHRWIIARRAFFVMSILYLMRSVTMFVTVLPVANTTVYCKPKLNSTSAAQIFTRVSDIIIGGGMQISGRKNSCGDYIYSGHTALLIHGYLFLKEYSPEKYYFVHWISWAMSWGGMGVILLARGHYSIDVLIGYYAATRMFWTYHTLANNMSLRVRCESNYHSNVWWFWLFEYLEGGVKAPLPKSKHYSPPRTLKYFSSTTSPRHSRLQQHFSKT